MPLKNPQTITFVIIRNPLVPDVKQFEFREHTQGKPLSEYIGELQGRYVFSVNGRIVNQDDLHLEVPESGDVIAIAPVPMGGGGGGGKMVMRLVVVVALAVFTYGQSLPYTLPGLTGLTGATLLAAQAAVMIGGTLLINSMLPYKTNMGSAGGSGSLSGDQTYGIDGAKNTSTEGIPIPVVYGRHRQAGNIIGNYTTMEGQTQYLHLLLNAGEGVAAGVKVGSILINDQPIDTLSDAQYRFFYGNDGQDTTGVFDRQITPNQITVNRELKNSSVWTEYTTSVEKEVEGVRLDFLANLYAINDKGDIKPRSVSVVAQIKPYGAPDSQFVSLLTGITKADAANGWRIDIGGRQKATAEIVQVKRGVQYIDKTRPNIFDEATKTYKNHYVLQKGKYVLQGDAVTSTGSKVSNIDRIRDLGDPSKVVAAKTLSSPSGLGPYEYGDLVSNGVVVGSYHKFHPLNIIVNGYNGTSTANTGNDVITMTGSSTSATLRFSYESPRLPEGRYQIRVRRTSNDSDDSKIGDAMVLNEVSEIIYSDVAYNHTALMYLKIKVSDQISSMPKVTFENLGRVIRVWDEKAGLWVSSADVSSLGIPKSQKERTDYPGLSAEDNKKAVKKLGTLTPNYLALSVPAHMLPAATSGLYVQGFYDHDNPAWIAWDMLTDTRFGGGIEPGRLDFWAFKKWADFCRSKGLTYRAVIDSKETLWDSLAGVFRVGRAVPVRTGTRYTVSVEMPKETTMRFGVDNIVEGSFSINWMSLNDRANEIELTYFDEEYDYKQRIIKIYDRAALARGAKPVSTSFKLVGVVTNEQAVREANFMLNTNKLVETITFRAPVESLACTIGSVVEVQHDMMTWGEAGKLAEVRPVDESSYDLVLDHEINFESGKDWTMTVQASVVSRGVFTVESVSAGYVTLTGFDSAKVGRVTRAVKGNIDSPVLDVFKGSNGKQGIVMRDYDALVPGSTVSLFDTDAAFTVKAVPSAYGVKTDLVRISGVPAGFTPQKFDHFMLGFPQFMAKLFTVRSIGLTSDDMTREITALEYDERVFDDTDTDFVVVDNAYERSLTAVEDVSITESAIYDNGKLAVNVAISWTHSEPTYKNAEVTVRVNGGQIQRLGRKLTHADLILQTGDEIELTITPYSNSGKAGAMMQTGYTVTGLPNGNNTMVVTGGSVSPINGGVSVSDLVFDKYRVKFVEIWGIRQGVVIPAGYGEGIVGGATHIEDVADPSVITGEGVELYGVLLGYADQLGRFTHIVTKNEDAQAQFFYWARTVDLVDSEGPFSFVGSGRPTRATAFNDVTVYTYAVDAPARPTGGSYDSPSPDQEIWRASPDKTGVTNPAAKLFISSRRFSSVPELSDPLWSLPAVIYDPNDTTIVEDAIKPTNVIVTSAFGAIRVSWDLPTYEGHQKTQVFVQRVLVDADGKAREGAKLDTATMLAQESTSTMVSIPAASGYGYYVWVRHVNQAGVEGTLHSATGSFVLVRLTPADMSALLDKQVKYDFLANDVTDAITKAQADAVASASGQIKTLDTNLSAKISAVTGQVSSEVTDRKAAIADVGKTITTLDSTLRGLINTANGQISAEIANRQAAITSEQKARADLETSLTSNINGVKSSVSTLSSTVSTLDGKYTAQWGVKTSVGSITGGVGFFNDGTKTSFLIEADSLALISRNASGTVLRSSPFKVVNGQAYIADAFIDKATVSTLVAQTVTADYVNALGISANKIAAGSSISAPVITGGTLDMGQCYIKDGAAGFGQGGPFSGWGKTWNTIIYADGSLNTNKLNAVGAINIGVNSGATGINITQNRIDVRDEKGVLRVRIGLL